MPGMWSFTLRDLGQQFAGCSPTRQQQRWAIVAAQPGRPTATVAHGCGSRDNDGPSLSLLAWAKQQRWVIVAVSRAEMPGWLVPWKGPGHRPSLENHVDLPDRRVDLP